jgi:hypothetical protein
LELNQGEFWFQCEVGLGSNQSFSESVQEILRIGPSRFHDSCISSMFSFNFVEREVHRDLGCKASSYECSSAVCEVDFIVLPGVERRSGVRRMLFAAMVAKPGCRYAVERLPCVISR